MKEIKCIYENGGEKMFSYDTFGKQIECTIKTVKQKKGMKYVRFLESSLQKVYIDGELAIDKGALNE